MSFAYVSIVGLEFRIIRCTCDDNNLDNIARYGTVKKWGLLASEFEKIKFDFE